MINEVEKRFALKKVEEIVNDFFDKGGRWAASKGLLEALEDIIEEYYQEEMDNI